MKSQWNNSDHKTRLVIEFCVKWLVFLHLQLEKGFLWCCRKVGEAFCRVAWPFRFSVLIPFAAALLFLFVVYGENVYLMSGFSDYEERVVKAADEDEEPTTDTVDVTRYNQIQKLKNAGLSEITIDPKNEKLNVAHFEKAMDTAGFRMENLRFDTTHLVAMYQNEMFSSVRSLQVISRLGAGLLAIGFVLSILCFFIRPIRRVTYYTLLVGGISFAAIWTVILFVGMDLPSQLLQLNRENFFDTKYRSVIWFKYLWLWIPGAVLSFFLWFPLLLSSARTFFGLRPRQREIGDAMEATLTCHGKDPLFARSGYWSFAYHFFILMVIPLLADSCMFSDEYRVPKGDGNGAVEVVVKKIKPKKKPQKKYVFNPNSEYIMTIPKLDDPTLLEELMEEVSDVHTATNLQAGKIGKGGKGTKAGWPNGMENGVVRFIRLEYRGGDWDQDMGQGADYNVLIKIKEYAGFNIAKETESIRVEELKRFKKGRIPPFLFITGGGNINMTPMEVKALRKYLIQDGGMLFADCGGGSFGGSFRGLMKRILPEINPVDIANDDMIYQEPFSFPNGAPAFFHHDGYRPLGWKHNGRWVVFYHPGDINDMWKTGASGTDKTTQERAFKLAANVVAYAFGQYLSIINK